MPPIDPDLGELRRFALVFAVFLPVAFMGIVPWLFSYGVPWWPAAASATLLLLRWLRPTWLAPVYRGWMRVAHVIGRVNTFLILSLLFFVVLTPFGAVLRLLGKLQYRRRIAPGQDSLWIERPAAERTTDLTRPF